MLAPWAGCSSTTRPVDTLRSILHASTKITSRSVLHRRCCLPTPWRKEATQVVAQAGLHKQQLEVDQHRMDKIALSSKSKHFDSATGDKRLYSGWQRPR
ncbi:hypothetical protein WJX72_002966 [[Myrmecia] bisecta]|uniref:Uncharacterized protein n=1 Tax=[Myrmecia] bisecta TaxID=41462 RepID=A0AAW1PWJ3_9CHLO